MKLIICGMIGNSDYIGASLNGWIQELLTKGINPFQFHQKIYLNKVERSAHCFGHSKIKELHIIEFFKKRMVEDMESELTDLSEIYSKTDNLVVIEEAVL